MFYKFDEELTLEECVERISKKSQKDGDCQIWSGEMSLGRPRLAVKKFDNTTKAFDIRRLLFQHANPTYALPKKKIACSVDSTCENDKCVNPDHLKVVTRCVWDPVAIRSRLDQKSTRQAPNDNFDEGCLLWNGQIRDGYGVMSVDNQKRPVHQIALLLNDDIRQPPTDARGKALLARHKCKNKHCLEVAHLEWGDAFENAQDRIRDGTNCRGENNAMASISEDLARQIKLSWRPMNHDEYQKQAQRAARFGVSVNIVSKIDAGESWAYLPGFEDRSPVFDKNNRILKARETRANGLSDSDRTILVHKINERVKSFDNMSKDPSIKSPCQIWQGAKFRQYGKVCYRYASFAPHIIVCEHALNASMPEGFVVRHLCGNMLCCAKDHLVPGSRSENAADAIHHGDLVCKLTVGDIQEIRNSADPPISDSEEKRLLETYHITKNWLKQILKGNTWKFIDNHLISSK